MNNPIRLFKSLSETFIRYLDSPFDLRYPDLVTERDNILDADGCLHREPLIEPVPQYQDCGQSFPQMAQTLLAGSWSLQEITDLSDFVSLQLFPISGPEERRPYTHQRDVFREAVVNAHDVVVTTGTGSGKTECFLLPILAQLLRESANQHWGPGGPRPQTWDWWTHGSQRVPQRDHENPGERPAALRALILYPLNALVEDQLGRLRSALDGPSARAWLQANRPHHRPYFGRYTGRTPVSGFRIPAKIAKLRQELLSASSEQQRVAGTAAERFFPKLDGGEMWSRWDMQDSPPDILITNYSMLNIMLMRSLETSVVSRNWLEVFHLACSRILSDFELKHAK